MCGQRENNVAFAYDIEAGFFVNTPKVEKLDFFRCETILLDHRTNYWQVLFDQDRRSCWCVVVF